ncbi:hypothetical protein D3C75_1052800 [compost metagenome]
MLGWYRRQPELLSGRARAARRSSCSADWCGMPVWLMPMRAPRCTLIWSMAKGWAMQRRMAWACSLTAPLASGWRVISSHLLLFHTPTVACSPKWPCRRSRRCRLSASLIA